jgi:neutral trehalase
VDGDWFGWGMKHILFILFILFNCSNLSARIGETLEQCKNRYGEIIEKKENTYVFNKNGFNVGVRLINNKVEFISFNKEDLAREKYFNEVEKWTEKLKAEYKEFQNKDRSITNAEWIVLFEANTKWKI